MYQQVFKHEQLPTLSCQTAAYEIICSSFTLKAIDKDNLLEGENAGQIQSFLKERFETKLDKE